MIRRTKYNNGISYKRKNARVTVIDDNNNLIIDLFICDGHKEPRTMYKNIKGKVDVTTFKINKSSAKLLSLAIYELLKDKEL